MCIITVVSFLCRSAIEKTLGILAPAHLLANGGVSLKAKVPINK